MVVVGRDRYFKNVCSILLIGACCAAGGLQALHLLVTVCSNERGLLPWVKKMSVKHHIVFL